MECAPKVRFATDSSLEEAVSSELGHWGGFRFDANYLHVTAKTKPQFPFDAAKVTLTAIRPMYIPRPLADLATPISDMAWCMGLSRCRRSRAASPVIFAGTIVLNIQ